MVVFPLETNKPIGSGTVSDATPNTHAHRHPASYPYRNAVLNLLATPRVITYS